MTVLAASRLTVPELAAMMREAIRNRSYQRETRLGAAVAQYLAWKQLGASARTFEIYEGYLARLCLALAYLDPAVDEVTEEMLTTALAEYPVGSRELVRTAYRGFFKWAAKRGGFVDPAADLPQIKAPSMKVYDVFTNAEQGRLLKATDELKLPWVQRLRVLVFIDLGVRSEEARLLQPYHFDTVNKVVVVKNGKGDKERIVDMGDEMWRAFLTFRNRPLPLVRQEDNRGRYREDRVPRDCDYLFFPMGASKTGQVVWTDPSRPLSDRMMRTWWAEYVVPAAGIKYRSLHMARHSVATDLATGGASLDEVQDWLGHADPKTTKVYIHNSRARLARARGLLDHYRQGRGG